MDERDANPGPEAANQPSRGEVTVLLFDLKNGDRDAAERLLPLVWDAMHARAVRMLAGRADGARWQPTAIVDEAYLKLVDQHAADWRDRRHFQAIAARVMRRVVSDQARFEIRARRDGRRNRPLPTEILDGGMSLEQLAELDDLLARLAEVHDRSAQVVELRFFGGLAMQEIAESLAVSLRTVEGDWHFARAWLHARLSE